MNKRLHAIKREAIMTFSRNLTLALAALCLLAPLASGATINYALNKPATASSSYLGAGGGNDGLLSTAWVARGWDAWWQVDLEAIVAIDDIAVFNADGGGYHTTFQLSSSTDGSTWSPIGAQTTGSGALYTFNFPTNGAEMRYIRYTTIGESGSDWGALIELQAFGSDQPQDQAPEPGTLVLLGAGLTALGLARRFRHQ
jgi:hypothetical protein